MLNLNAFFHLPRLAELFDEIARDPTGMVVVAGLDAREPSDAAPSSGKGFVYGILARHILALNPHTRAAIVTDAQEPALRLSSREKSRVKVFAARPDDTYADTLERAARLGFPILFTERMGRDSMASALTTARAAHRVVTQLDSPLCGAWVARELAGYCEDDELIRALKWVVAVRRVPTLCDQCKMPDGAGFRADGCAACDQTGERGDMALFDVWRADPDADPFTLPSALSFRDYAAALAAGGYVSARTVRELETEQLYQTHRVLLRLQEQQGEANPSLRARVAALESANRVLEQQYRVSIALQEVGRQLLELDSVEELAAYIARRARELTGADRAALYLLHPDGMAEIAALTGWAEQWLHERVPFEQLQSGDGEQPTPLNGYPPGIPARVADLEGAHIRAGLNVPLVAQREVVGAMIFHSTVRRSFEPRDTALLHALANVSAAAIQRTGLIHSLRDKVDQLEAAHAQLAAKERLERELELARQVQQTMLPHIFPLLPGVAFYARNEPARQVGGDFYDVFVLDGDRVGVVIADVSDKGMPAALFMALTRSLVRAEAPRERSPEQVLRRVHRLLLDTAEPTQFVTLFYGVMDLTQRTLTYVRAGHDYPLLAQGDRVMLLDAFGTILGLLNETELQLTEAVVPLIPPTRLVLYTDGMTDAFDAEEAPFGRARLAEAVMAMRHAPLQEMGDAIFRAVAEHQGANEIYDDMTLLIAELR